MPRRNRLTRRREQTPEVWVRPPKARRLVKQGLRNPHLLAELSRLAMSEEEAGRLILEVRRAAYALMLRDA